MAASRTIRPPLAITLGVWKAMFLREAVTRISRDRMAWVWLLVEPIAHVVLVMYMFSVIKQRVIYGADAAIFIMLGVLAFVIPRNIMNRCRAVVQQNRALYTYRQVLPVDGVIVRAGIEAFLQFLVTVFLLMGAALLGLEVLPVDPLKAVAALASLALVGLGLGLIISVAVELVPNLARVMRLCITPLYFISAVLYPSMLPPRALRDILLLNPLVHGIESLRLAFMPEYQVPPNLSLAYVYAWAVSLVFLGLLLHVRFQKLLISR